MEKETQELFFQSGRGDPKQSFILFPIMGQKQMSVYGQGFMRLEATEDVTDCGLCASTAICWAELKCGRLHVVLELEVQPCSHNWWLHA